MLQLMNAYQMAFVNVIILNLMGVQIKIQSKLPEAKDYDTIKNRELQYNLTKKIIAFIDEMKSIGDDAIEANDDEELGEIDFNIKVTKIWISAIEKVEAMNVMSTLSEKFISTIC